MILTTNFNKAMSRRCFNTRATLADVAWELDPGKCKRCGETRCLCVRGTYGLQLAEKGAMAPFIVRRSHNEKLGVRMLFDQKNVL
jgi:NifB/MoaA-like Fe-S oxidoreductase